MKTALESLMNPESIAIVGASNNPMKMGTQHALSILKDGFKGEFYPVHPTEKEVLGHTAFSHPCELPKTPDLAIFVIPSDPLPELFESFGKIGTSNAIVVTAGFKETGTEGMEQEIKLNDIAKHYGIRFLGPNCMGFINTQISLNTTVMPIKAKPGILGFASQSGTYITQSLPYLSKKGIRFSKAISVGNEANINIIDAIEYLGQDEHTQAIAVYLECIRDIPLFLKTAREITPHKPIIAQYVGGSEAGARSGLSHTGAMAAPNHLYNGLFKQAGVIRVDSIEELYGFGWALASLPRIRGNRIAVLTNSGGPGSAMADTCEAKGLVVPELSQQRQEKIKPLVPPHAPCRNPVDLTFSMDIGILAKKIPELVLQSGEVDGIVLHGAMGSGFLSEKYPHLRELLNDMPLETFLEQLQNEYSGDIQLPSEYQIPMVVSSFFDQNDNYTKSYQDNNIPVFDAPEKAACAMACLANYNQISNRQKYSPPKLPEPLPQVENLISSALSIGQSALDEHQSKTLLHSYGIPVSTDYLANSDKEVMDATEKMGYPVVLKACDPQILHKTEKGLVHLNLKTVEQTLDAYHAIQQSVGRNTPVIVSKMLLSEREFVAGMTRDKAFGPSILFGLGGIFTEVFQDITFRVPPLSDTEAKEMLEDIRSRNLLNAFRNLPPTDKEALALMLKRLGYIAVLHPEIAEIDLNPIIIDNGQPVAADALIVLKN